MIKKNLVAALSAVLVVGVAGSIFAAPVVTLTGSVAGNATYQQKATDLPKGAHGNQSVVINTSIAAGDKVKGVIQFAGLDQQGRSMETAPGTVSLGISKAYLQTKGAWLNGGQDVTTTIGDYDVAYSPYASTLAGRGIKVEGGQVGPMSVEGFYGFRPGDAVFGGKVGTKVAGIDLAADGLRQGTEIAGHGRVGLSPVKGIDVSADYAMNQKTSTAPVYTAMFVEGKAELSPVLALRGTYRNFDSMFSPSYHLTNGDAVGNPSWIEQYVGDKGFHAGADMALGSVKTSVDWDQPDKTLEGKASTKLVGFDVTGRVKATNMNYSDSTLGLAKTMPIMGYNVASSYTLDHAAATGFKHAVDVSTTVPNGFSVGAGYSTDKGVNARAGLSLGF